MLQRIILYNFLFYFWTINIMNSETFIDSLCSSYHMTYKRHSSPTTHIFNANTGLVHRYKTDSTTNLYIIVKYKKGYYKYFSKLISITAIVSITLLGFIILFRRLNRKMVKDYHKNIEILSNLEFRPHGLEGITENEQDMAQTILVRQESIIDKLLSVVTNKK